MHATVYEETLFNGALNKHKTPIEKRLKSSANKTLHYITYFSTGRISLHHRQRSTVLTVTGLVNGEWGISIHTESKPLNLFM